MPDWLVYRLFWTKPCRRWMVKLACWRRTPQRLMTWLEDQLYPDNITVSFAPFDETAP